MAKKQDDKKLLPWGEAWRMNLRALKLYYKLSPQVMIIKIIRNIWDALTPYVGIYLSALIIEELSGRRDPERLKALVLAALFSAAFLALASSLIGRYQTLKNVTLDEKEWFLLSEKMLDLDYCIAEDPATRRQLSTIRQNSHGGGWGIGNVPWYFEKLLQAVCSLLGGIALTVSLFASRVPEEAEDFVFLNSPLFAFLFLAVMLAVTWLSAALSTKAGSYRAINSDTHNLSNRLFSYFGFMGERQALAPDMRIYRQDKFCMKYNNDKKDTFHSQGMFAKLAKGPMGLCQSAATAVSTFLLTGIIYFFVCLKAWAGAFGIGMVTQYIGAISRFSGNIGSLITGLGNMRNNASFVKQSFDFLDIPNTMYQGSLTVEKRRDRNYEVEFKDVSFRYPGSEQYALRHVNMKFKIGQRVAVVGENGSGKTTFIKLLCRLYDPEEGAIFLNGIDIRKYDYHEYISIFSVVFQDFALTSFTLGQNTAAATDYDKEKAESCLQKAGFGERLQELPEGLETYLDKTFSEEGVAMSGGECQKIAIARSLYKDAPFIVLDEPTAALDPVAEAEIYSKLNEIIEDRTAVYISHRLSSCRFCDEILVFHQGSIVQQGSHNTLVEDEKGKYHELWHAQAQYYTEEAS